MRAWRGAEVACFVDGAEPFARLPGNDGFPLLEWCLQWCVSVHCHQYLIVRGVALERHGRTLLLPGPEGVGKSTLAAGLALCGGWRLLSDVLALVDLDTGRVLPLPRPVCVDDAAMAAIKSLQPSATFAASEHSLPHGRLTYLSLPKSEWGHDQSVMPAWLVFARYAPEGVSHLRPLDRAVAFMYLAEQSLNYNVHGRRGFGALAKIIDACDCHLCAFGSLSGAMTMFSSLAVGAGLKRS